MKKKKKKKKKKRRGKETVKADQHNEVGSIDICM
jgi:hypothetical protein